MNWEAVGAIGEIVGAVAVVVTLIYLIVQIKQNTRSVHAATIQTNVSDFNSLNIHLATTPKLAEIFDRGSADPEGLSAEEQYSFLWLSRSYMNLYQNLFDQYQQGTLPERVWNKHTDELKALMAQPGMLRFRVSDTYYEELWAYIDTLPKRKHTTSLSLKSDEHGDGA
ncbi:MAG: hypothetical protein ACFHX7_20750 [Pseudomonadota bacterium]